MNNYHLYVYIIISVIPKHKCFGSQGIK